MYMVVGQKKSRKNYPKGRKGQERDEEEDQKE
jgi:hypothetical protein